MAEVVRPEPLASDDAPAEQDPQSEELPPQAAPEELPEQAAEGPQAEEAQAESPQAEEAEAESPQAEEAPDPR